MTEAAGADLGVTQPSAVEAAAKLSELMADKAWAAKLLSGDGPQVKEFAQLMAAKSGSAGEGDRLDQIIAGTIADPAPFETVTNGQLTTRNQITSAEALRDLGVSPGAIRQVFEAKPSSRADYDAVRNLKADRLGDQDWIKRYLAGDRTAVRDMALMNIVLVGGYKEEKAAV